MAKVVLENVIGLLIFAAIVVMIIVVGVKVSNFQLGDERNAQKFLDSLVEKMESIGENQTGVLTLQGVDNWYLTGWSKSENPEIKPEACFLESCLCICEGGGNKGSCETNGFCEEIDKEIEIVSFVANRAPLPNTNENFCVLYKDGCVTLPKNLITEFRVRTEESKIVIMEEVSVEESGGEYIPTEESLRKRNLYSCWKRERAISEIIACF